MRKTKINPQQVRLFDPREESGYREAFRSVPKTSSTTYSSEYYAQNRERICANQRAYYKKKKRNEKARTYYAAHRDHLLELQRKSYKKRLRRNRLSQSWLWRVWLRIETLFDRSQRKKIK